MFFPHRLTLPGAPLAVTAETTLVIPASFVAAGDYLQTAFVRALACAKPTDAPVCGTVTFACPIPDDVRATLREQGFAADRDEQFALVADADKCTVDIYADDANGLLYGFAALTDHVAQNVPLPALLYDYPTCGVRGYRVYLPGRAQFDEFRAMVDLLAAYRYNTIILEIGGAMEYRRHGEINEAWAAFCADMHRYSGRAHEVQRGYPWEKDSIHCDNGDGDILTQDECRDLAAYCRARGLEVIPECPTMSHSDYICLAHPELREREEDPYPDTYCPRHPDVYPLVFDLLDEVIEVFAPRRMNIGHDELYTVGICPRCKDADPVDLYVEDIRTLRDYLAGRGIETLMWGEKLLCAVDPDNGKRYGGWCDAKTRHGVTYKWPDLWPCRDKMPSGVTFLHWYWWFDHQLDEIYLERGYPFIFANFNALRCAHFRDRINAGCLGGIVSNWGANESEYMQRNLQYFALIGTAYALWCDDFDTDDRLPAYIDATMREAFRRRVAATAHPLYLTHATDHTVKFKHFYDGIFIEDEVYLLGHWRLRYADGGEALLPVKYGTNITTSAPGDPCVSDAYAELCGGALPQTLPDGRVAWTTVYEDPRPGEKACAVEYVPAAGKEDVGVTLINA